MRAKNIQRVNARLKLHRLTDRAKLNVTTIVEIVYHVDGYLSEECLSLRGRRKEGRIVLKR